jgi:hypothetical protein
MGLGSGRGAPRIEINKIVKCRMEVSRPLKSKGVEDAAGVIVVLGVVLEFFRELDLRRLPMSEAVCDAGGGRNEVTKVRMKRVIIEGDNDIRAEAGSWAAVNVIFDEDGRSTGLKGIKAMYPRGRFGKFVSQNV